VRSLSSSMPVSHCSCCNQANKRRPTCGKKDHPCLKNLCFPTIVGGRNDSKCGDLKYSMTEIPFQPITVSLPTVIPYQPFTVNVTGDLKYRLPDQLVLQMQNTCQQPNCSNPKKFGWYCGKHRCKHTLQTGIEQATKDGDLFAKELFSRLFESRFEVTNPLQPKFDLKTRSPAAETKSNADFLKIMETYTSYLLCLLGTEKHRKVIDQKMRARKLAEKCGPHITTVYLMDGHGAFTLLFLSNVQEMYGPERLNNLNVVIVDIDREVTDYHKKFFQTQSGRIQCYLQDITSCPKGPENLIYMNFCGITKALPAVKNFVKSCNPTQPLVISFSIARMKNDKKMNIFSQIQKSSPNGAEFERLKTGRKDFRTIWLQPASSL